jgi:hypothetical protein
MAASGKTMNIRNVVFTPDGGPAIPLRGITGVSCSGGGSIQKFAGDGDHFNTTVVNDFADPTVTINSGDRPSAQSLAQGMRGTLSYVVKDARNILSATLQSGDTSYTLSKAVVQSIDFADNFRQFGTNTITLCSESSDGITSPISLTVTS